MEINANFENRVAVHSVTMPWIGSPMPGVTRRPMDRVGNEVARATTIVRYEPNSKFSSHVHTGGEEFVVIDGVFQDEHGDFPTGSYVRNPPQSSHTPRSKEGCIIFVKLWQFNPEDRTHVRLNYNFMKPMPHHDINGIAITPLYIDQYEEVSIYNWDANTQIDLKMTNGAEILVLEGGFTEGNEIFSKHSWLRLPIKSVFNARTGLTGSKLWIKQNHLPFVTEQIERVTNSSALKNESHWASAD